MQLIVKEETVGELIPSGMHQAVCAMVCDIGTHKGEYMGVPNEKHQGIVIWELNELKTLGQFAGQRFQASKFYTLSLDEKANLRKDLQSWRGKPFTPEELKGFDLEKLIGVNCFLNITHDNGKAKISAITPLAKGMTPIKSTLDKEPDWVGKKRAESKEAKADFTTYGDREKQQPNSANVPPPPDLDVLPF